MREIKLTENQKSTDKKKKDWEFRKIIKREKENKQTLRLSLLLLL